MRVDEDSQDGRGIAEAASLLSYYFVDRVGRSSYYPIHRNLALNNNAIDRLYWASPSRGFTSPSHLDPSKSM